jgi:hypothetical protein
LLISCQNLNGLYIFNIDNQDHTFYWDKLFDILAKSLTTRLFKFKFYTGINELPNFISFFDNWKGRQPMFLQIISDETIDQNIK